VPGRRPTTGSTLCRRFNISDTATLTSMPFDSRMALLERGDRRLQLPLPHLDLADLHPRHQAPVGVALRQLGQPAVILDRLLRLLLLGQELRQLLEGLPSREDEDAPLCGGLVGASGQHSDRGLSTAAALEHLPTPLPRRGAAGPGPGPQRPAGADGRPPHQGAWVANGPPAFSPSVLSRGDRSSRPWQPNSRPVSLGRAPEEETKAAAARFTAPAQVGAPSGGGTRISQLILDHDGVGTAGPENKASAEEINKISGRNILCLIATLSNPIRSRNYGFDEDLTDSSAGSSRRAMFSTAIASPGQRNRPPPGAGPGAVVLGRLAPPGRHP
jgi:hypothetical protein